MALTLRLLGGLTTPEIARAFLVSGGDHRAAHRPRQAHARRGARAVRGPRQRRAAGASVLGARGHLPHLQRGLRGDRRRATGCARRCARTRCGSGASSPSWCRASPRSTGCVALMELQASRCGARIGPARRAGAASLDQDRSRWDQLLVQPRARGARRAPRRSAARSARTRCRPRSPPATRARERRARPTGRGSSRSTTRSRQLTGSPVVELNRAVAVSMAFGPAAGLELVDALAHEPALA